MFTSESQKSSNSQFAAANELANEGHNPDYKGYYQKTAAARAALSEGDTLEVNVNVPSAVRVANRALPRILSLREQMQGLPVALAAINGVGVFAGALAYVHALYAVETAPPRAMQALYEHLLGIRRLLRADAVNLATRGLVNGETLRALTGETGFRNVAYDVIGLVSIHETAAPHSAGRTAVTKEDLAAATADASQLLNLAAQGEKRLEQRSELKEQRRRAFTLLVNAYDEARRTVMFLLWKEPAKYLPSLFAARGAGRPKNVNATVNREEVSIRVRRTKGAKPILGSARI